MEMLFGYGCKPYIPVDTAEECKVGRDGGNILSGIIYMDSERIRSVNEQNVVISNVQAVYPPLCSPIFRPFM